MDYAPRQPPSQDTRIPACEKLFAIPELWLNFIEFVDVRGIFSLLQVCHLFYDRINKDDLIWLQPRLFLHPEDAVISNSPGEREQNQTDSLQTAAHNLKLNPMLAHISISPFIDWSDFAKRTRNSNPPRRVPLMQTWDVDNKHICIYPVREGGSESRWNKMFVTQPPITTVSLAVPAATGSGEYGSGYPKEVTICNPSGLKIDDVVREWRNNTNGNEYSAAMPACIIIHGWASYERFYSAYRTVLMESNAIIGRSLARKA
ncbi:hypothetical protein BLS_002000 [Venturia inaequalis]|uniref:F-box domain-containing protein n=1 Tax=Venturia inaequalis TaxID=5025 RepID=A0A8H3UW88_VENIN|nr:hypothetical protein BLS_002000 [Venturia inaequalis]